MVPPPTRNSSNDDHRKTAGDKPAVLTEQSFIEAAFNALPTQVAILDSTGEIVYTNAAWQSFGEENGLTEPSHTLGMNYLHVCERSSSEMAQTVAAGIKAVLDGSHSEFSFEYPCHSPDERRWFTMRAIHFTHDGQEFVLVLHLNITDRKLSELSVQEQNAELETLVHVNNLIRDIIDSLLAGTTRSAIEADTCEQLAGSSLFHSAYIINRTLDENGITIRTAAGIEDTTVDTLETISSDEITGSAFTTALTEIDSCAIGTVAEQSAIAEPLAEVARNNGYESVLVVPIRHRETVYALLVVNAVDPDVFNEGMQSAFDVLGEAIGYACNAIENKQILFADTVTRLTFTVPASDSLLARLTARTGCQIDLEGIVPGEESDHTCYMRIEGASPETVLTTLSELDGIAGVRVVSERTDDFLLECTIQMDSPLVALVGYGATIETARAEEGQLTLSANVAPETDPGTDVRTVVESFVAVHPNAELVAKQQAERSLQTVRGFRGELDHRLTDRQQDVLEAAYYAGYFDQPRTSTGEEVAESLGVTRQTFHHHLRLAETTVFTHLFEEGALGGSD